MAYRINVTEIVPSSSLLIPTQRSLVFSHNIINYNITTSGFHNDTREKLALIKTFPTPTMAWPAVG